MLLLLAALIWGSSFVVQQIGTGGMGTITFTGARFFLGGLVVLPFGLRQLRKVTVEAGAFPFSAWRGLLATGCILLVAACLQQHGILRTTVTNSGFLTALYVPMVPMLGWLLLGRKVPFAIWPASICCFIGTYILSGAHDVSLASGDLWVISSSLFWAIHVIMVGLMATRTQAPLVVATTQFLVAGLLGLCAGIFLETPDFAQVRSAVWGIMYIGIFSVGAAFTLQVVGQRFTPASDAAIILSSETVFAALGGMIFLGEHLSWYRLSGGMLILTAILAIELVPLTRIGRPRPL
jgi:drug/metabolite transporter (DMT)-like permease